MLNASSEGSRRATPTPETPTWQTSEVPTAGCPGRLAEARRVRREGSVDPAEESPVEGFGVPSGLLHYLERSGTASRLQ